MRLNQNSNYPSQFRVNPYSRPISKSITIQDNELLSVIISTGQRPLVCLYSKGIAQLGVRQGSIAGFKVTLRGRKRFHYYFNRTSKQVAK